MPALQCLAGGHHCARAFPKSSLSSEVVMAQPGIALPLKPMMAAEPRHPQGKVSGHCPAAHCWWPRGSPSLEGMAGLCLRCVCSPGQEQMEYWVSALTMSHCPAHGGCCSLPAPATSAMSCLSRAVRAQAQGNSHPQPLGMVAGSWQPQVPLNPRDHTLP